MNGSRDQYLRCTQPLFSLWHERFTRTPYRLEAANQLTQQLEVANAAEPAHWAPAAVPAGELAAWADDGGRSAPTN